MELEVKHEVKQGFIVGVGVKEDRGSNSDYRCFQTQYFQMGFNHIPANSHCMVKVH